jgi:hypothetical protein
MKIIAVNLFVLLLFLGQPVLASDFLSAVDSLTDYPTDSLREIKVEDFTLTLRYGQVYFKRGELYLTGYFRGSPTAAFFIGHGRFRYNPPDAIEAQQVHRFYLTDSVDVKFDEAYFAFPWNSDLLNEMKDKGAFTDPSYRIKSFLKAMRDIPDKKFRYNLPLNVYKAAIENRPDYLWINLLKDRYFNTVYVYDPYSPEQVSLYKYTSNFRTPQVVSSIIDDQVDSSKIINSEFDLFQYDIAVDISTVGNSQISCTMHLSSLIDSLKIAEFIFPREYKVDSVKGDIVDSTAFIKKKDRPGLAIELADYLDKGDSAVVSVYYSTNLFRHLMHYGVIQEHLTYWYPYNGYRQLSEYRVDYRIVKGFDFLAVGDRLTDSTSGDKRYLEYLTPPSTAYISFTYGVFDSISVLNTSIPITIHFLKSDRPSVIFGNDNLTGVVNDISASFKFYNDSLAPYPLSRLDVASTAVGFGQGSPGLVHLSKITFNRSIKGVDDKFRAHEVAHQWWGHLINPESYHDVWLSEGFAEYSAAMYIELIKKDRQTFLKILKDWHKAVINGGQFDDKKSIGFKAGAIILGHRLASEMSPGDFETIIYYKSAYLLHMLRYELESAQGRQGAFMYMLSEFARIYSGQLVTSGDFVDLARTFLGENGDQFFDQWLYDWRVPKIKKKDKKKDDGTVELTLSVEKVGENFETAYPVKFIFSDNSEETVIYKIKDGVNRFVYSPHDGEQVKKVEYNPVYDILEQ